jgi:hypothetical protein
MLPLISTGVWKVQASTPVTDKLNPVAYKRLGHTASHNQAESDETKIMQGRNDSRGAYLCAST